MVCRTYCDLISSVRTRGHRPKSGSFTRATFAYQAPAHSATLCHSITHSSLELKICRILQLCNQAVGSLESKQNERSLGDHLQLGMTPSQLGKFETNQDYIGMSWKPPGACLFTDWCLIADPFVTLPWIDGMAATSFLDTTWFTIWLQPLGPSDLGIQSDHIVITLQSCLTHVDH